MLEKKISMAKTQRVCVRVSPPWVVVKKACCFYLWHGQDIDGLMAVMVLTRMSNSWPKFPGLGDFVR